MPRETVDAVFVLSADGVEHAVPRAEIIKMKASNTSVMPPGLNRVVEPSVLADLLAFLQSLK